MTKKYQVQGMSCGGCADSVERAIQSLDSAILVQVDLERGEVSVDGLDDDAAVQRAIESAGFQFIGSV